MKKGYVDLADGQLHYAATTGTGAPLIFLHQTASSWQMWAKIIERLTDLGAPAIAFDTPGFGGSFDPAEPPSMPDYARWIAEALDSLGTGPVHLIGHHTGAAIACQLAADRPELVRSLTMFGPITCTAAEREELSRHAGPAFSPETSGAYVRDNWDYLVAGGAAADPLLIHRELIGMLRAHVGRSHAYAAVWTQDFTALFETLAQPMQILCAPDDDLWPYFERACSLRPDATAVKLPGGANFEPDLEPQATADAIRNFVVRHG
ncbi:MAG: alpha/beta fold hydrolase [Pseudomonadota bacterium]